MHVILGYVEQYIETKISPVDGKSKWVFSPKDLNLGPLVLRQSLLNFQYSALCKQIVKTMDSYDPNKESALKEQLIAALALAQILEEIYQHYLPATHEYVRFHNAQVDLQRILRTTYKISFDKWIDPIDEQQAFTYFKYTRNTIGDSNWKRLFLLRVKRVFDAVNTFRHGAGLFGQAVGFAGMILNPVFTTLSWLFYLPRLLVDLIEVAVYTLPFIKRNKKQEDLGFWIRLLAQLDFERRWFETGNDGVWMSVGLINCFILVGALAPAAMYLTVGLYVFDVFLAALRVGIEGARYIQLRKHYKGLGAEGDEFRHYLSQRMMFEMARLTLSLLTATALLATMCLTLALLSTLNPVIPLIGCCLVLSVTVGTFLMGKVLEHFNPDKNLTAEKIKTYSDNRSQFFAQKRQEDWENWTFPCNDAEDMCYT